MKPTIPETGQIVRIDGEMAVVMLRGGESCKGCGAGKIGLCRPSGNISMLTVRNTLGASVGDRIKIGLAKNTQTKGFLFAFIIPFVSFLGGSFIGYVLGKDFSIPSLEVIAAFVCLLLGSWYSFKQLRRLDRSSTMVITEIMSDKSFRDITKTEEERRFENYGAKC